MAKRHLVLIQFLHSRIHSFPRSLSCRRLHESNAAQPAPKGEHVNNVSGDHDTEVKHRHILKVTTKRFTDTMYSTLYRVLIIHKVLIDMSLSILTLLALTQSWKAKRFLSVVVDRESAWLTHCSAWKNSYINPFCYVEGSRYLSQNWQWLNKY